MLPTIPSQKDKSISKACFLHQWITISQFIQLHLFSKSSWVLFIEFTPRVNPILQRHHNPVRNPPQPTQNQNPRFAARYQPLIIHINANIQKEILIRVASFL